MEVPEPQELFSPCGTKGAMRKEPYFSTIAKSPSKNAPHDRIDFAQHTFRPLFMPNSEQISCGATLSIRGLRGLPQLHQQRISCLTFLTRAQQSAGEARQGEVCQPKLSASMGHTSLNA